MNIIVTGATSFIGVHLINELLDKECIIYAIVRPNSINIQRLPKSDKLKIIELDMTDYERLTQFVENADVFYHFAWEGVRAPHRDDEDLQKNNYDCSVNAMKVAVKLGVKLFIGSGSQAEYGKTIGKVDESYECKPITEYGKYKYKAYLELNKIAQINNICFIWTRIFSVYGKYDYNGTLIMSCLDKMLKNETIKMTECTQSWDYIYVGDIAEALAKLLEVKVESGVYNIASGNSKQLKYYVEELKKLLKSDSVIEYGAIPYPKEGVVSFEPVVGKIQKALEWKATTKFSAGIEKTLNIFKQK